MNGETEPRSGRESLARASILTFLSGNATFAIGLALNVLIARALGPSAKGAYAVFLNTQALLVVPAFALEVALLYVIARRRPDRTSLNRFVARIAAVQAVLSVAVLGVAIQIPAVHRGLLPTLPSAFLPVVALSLGFAFWERYRSTLLPGVQRYGKFMVLSACTALLSSIVVAGTIAGLWLSHHQVTPQAVILATTAGTVVSAAIWQRITARASLPEANPTTPGAIAREVRSLGAPVFLRTLLEWASYRIDVYLVNAIAGARSLGVYTVAIGGGQQLLAVPLALANPLYSRIAHDGDTPDSRDTTRYAFKMSCIASLFLALVAAIAAPVLLPVVYGRAFEGAVGPLLLFLPGVVASGSTRVFNSYFIGCQRNIETVRAEAVGLAVTVALDLALVPRLGIVGAAATASVAYTASSAVLAWRFVALTGCRWAELLVLGSRDRERLARAWSGVYGGRSVIRRKRS